LGNGVTLHIMGNSFSLSTLDNGVTMRIIDKSFSLRTLGNGVTLHIMGNSFSLSTLDNILTPGTLVFRSITTAAFTLHSLPSSHITENENRSVRMKQSTYSVHAEVCG